MIHKKWIQMLVENTDHSIMYIFAVALEDGDWHHEKSYSKSRSNRKTT